MYSPCSLFGVEGAFSELLGVLPPWLLSGVLGGSIGLGAGLSDVASGGSSNVLSMGTCWRCGAKWCLQTYTEKKVSNSKTFVKHNVQTRTAIYNKLYSIANIQTEITALL